MIKIKLSLTNTYLIPIENSYLLVDTGYPRDQKILFEQLNKHQITPKDISYLLLTHIHDDHVGLIHEILSKNPECKLIYHKNAIPFLARGKNDMSRSFYINKRVKFAVSTFGKLSAGTFPSYSPRQNDVIISEDTALADLGINLSGKIITTPGHTTDSISLILDDGSCFSGDAASNMLSFLGTKNCVVVMEDLDTYYSSWKKYIKEHAKTIYPSHGNAFSIKKLQKNINKQFIKK